MKFEYEFIKFAITNMTQTRKTFIYDCFDKSAVENVLGQVRWYGPWRQYCFFPEPYTNFNRTCLDNVRHFIQQLMDERKG